MTKFVRKINQLNKFIIIKKKFYTNIVINYIKDQLISYYLFSFYILKPKKY